VSHEVIAAEVVRASNKVAMESGRIEAQALPANAGHHLGFEVFPKLRSIDAIEVIKKRAVGLESAIQVPTGPPREFATDAKVVFKKDVGAEDGVSSATLGDGGAAALGNRARRRGNATHAKGGVKLLAESIGLYHKKQA
jgi:hypothetical protein